MKKVLVLILSLIIATCATLGFTACNEVEFELKFVVDGEVYHTVKTGGNEAIALPTNPTKEGCTFGGWYWDKDEWQKPFTANSLLDARLSSDMSVYANWIYHTHILTHNAKVEATCTADGNVEYWHCQACDKNYSDANASSVLDVTVIPKHGLTHNAKISETCTSDGVIEYWHCQACDKNYSDANATVLVSSIVIPKSHSYSDGLCIHCNKLQSEGLVLTKSGDAYSVAGYTGNSSDVVIPSNYNNLPVTSIGAGAFYSCTLLKNITIPNSVTSIGENAFKYCSSLVSIVIPNYITSIEGGTFYDCTSLTSVTIGNGVSTISSNAFNGCFKIVEVYDLSEHVTVTKGERDNGDVGYYALDVYTSASAKSKLTTTSDGYMFYEDGDTVYLVGYAGNSTTLMLPDKYNNKSYEIRRFAFYDCGLIESMAIPSSVTSIGYSAFDKCTNLKYNIYDNAYYLGNSDNPYVILIKAASTSITSCTVNENTKFVYEDAFYGCSSVKKITIPSSVTSIGSFAFWNCTSLESIRIPSGVGIPNLHPLKNNGVF